MFWLTCSYEKLLKKSPSSNVGFKLLDRRRRLNSYAKVVLPAPEGPEIHINCLVIFLMVLSCLGRFETHLACSNVQLNLIADINKILK